MLSQKAQAENLWIIYNRQEQHNNYWKLLFLLLFRNARQYLNSMSQASSILEEKKIFREYKKNINQISEEIEKYLEEHLKDTYIKTWEVTCTNLEHEIELPDMGDIYKDINKIWVGEKNFKQRQRHNTGVIKNKMQQVIESDLSNEEKLEEIEKLIKQYKNMVERLVRTETVHTMGQSSIKCMLSHGISSVIWITCMDERECRVCGARDKHSYPIDMIPQYPDHPNCRCLLLAYK